MLVTLAATAACAGDDGDVPRTISGRVMSKTEDRGYCVSADRGATQRCVPLAQSDDELEVGQCVTMTNAPTPDAVRLTLADDAACAAGDLGEDAGGGDG